MKKVHNIKITDFVKQGSIDNLEVLAESDLQDIISFVANIFGIGEAELKDKGIIIKKEKIQSVAEFKEEMIKNTIYIEYSADELLNGIIESLSEESVDFLKDTLESRIHKTGEFFMRFDRKGFFTEGALSLIDGGDCIHVRCKLVAYPQNKENVRKVVEELLK